MGRMNAELVLLSQESPPRVGFLDARLGALFWTPRSAVHRLINLYLRDCGASHRKLNLQWK